ncbi:MAG: hypothetical protein Q7Q71_09680 [Verrucomicrobiota bacterium JB023]|nr:hypothetical protein [Verrucomicrobiota bacterium JB023]
MKQRKTKPVELRVVDESPENPPVERLDAPSRRKGHTPGEVKIALPDSPLAEPEEEAEASEAEPVQPFVIPPAFIFIAVVLFLAMLGYGAFLLMGSDEQSDNLATEVREKLAAQAEMEEKAKDMVEQVNESIDGFSSAETVEEMAQWVRHRERVLPLMKAHYENHPLEPKSGATLIEQIPISLDTKTFLVLSVRFDDESSRSYLAEYTLEGEVLIDWESIVCYQPKPIDVLLNERPTESFDLRVYARPDNFYIYDFRDSDKYQCIKLSFRDSELELYAYVERESVTALQLKRYIGRAYGRGEPCLLRVRFLEGSHPSTGVLVEEFLASRWAYVDNPDDE